MPFRPPWRDDFHAGDLVYGLAMPRGRWILAHGAALGMNWIDKFVVNLDAADGKDEPARTLNISFLEATLRHRKYHSVVSTLHQPATTASQQHSWRTKSKAGLNWAVHEARKHVHFILDDLT